MREFFIESFEKIVAVIIVLMGIGVLLAAVGASREGGFIAFLAVLLIGALYVIVMGGVMYLGLGIYHNTKRMADAMDRSNPQTSY